MIRSAVLLIVATLFIRGDDAASKNQDKMIPEIDEGSIEVYAYDATCKLIEAGGGHRLKSSPYEAWALRDVIHYPFRESFQVRRKTNTGFRDPDAAKLAAIYYAGTVGVYSGYVHGATPVSVGNSFIDQGHVASFKIWELDEDNGYGQVDFLGYMVLRNEGDDYYELWYLKEGVRLPLKMSFSARKLHGEDDVYSTLDADDVKEELEEDVPGSNENVYELKFDPDTPEPFPT